MAKGKKKQRNQILLLLAVLIILIVAYILLIKKNNTSTEGNEESTSIEVTGESMLSYQKDEIKQITVTNEYGTLSYILDEDIVKNVDNLDLPLNQTYGNNMFNGLAELSTTKSLGTVLDIGEYGLDNPSIIVKIEGNQGEDVVLLFGDTVPSDGGRYATIEGSNEVYIVSNLYYNYYNYSKVTMTEMETLPTITTDYITRIEISKGDDIELSVSYDENKPSDLSGANFWSVTSDNRSFAGSTDDIATFLSNYGSFSYVECVDYDATDLSKYGLDNPRKIAVSYYELEAVDGSEETKKIEKELVLYIGNEEDDNYYVKEKSSSSVYTMSSTNVTKLLTYDVFTLANNFVGLINIINVDTIEISGEINQSISIVKGDKIEDSEEYNYSYLMGEKEIDEDTFKTFYQELIGIKYDRSLLESEKENEISKTPSLSITYHLIDGTIYTIEYFTFDDNYYQASVNGSKTFLVDKREITELVEKEKLLQ